MESPTSLHTLGLGPEVHPNDLESNLRRLNPAQVISAYLELMDHVKRMERQADLREELLRRNQRQIESKERIIKDREMLIRKMERDLERIDEEPESVSLAPSGNSNRQLEDWMDEKPCFILHTVNPISTRCFNHWSRSMSFLFVRMSVSFAQYGVSWRSWV